MDNRERAILDRGIREGARREVDRAPSHVQARIALRGATIGASMRGEDPARAHVSGDVRAMAHASAPFFVGACDGKRAEARTPRAEGDARLWAPSDRRVNGALVRVRPTAHDDTREGTRTREIIDRAARVLDVADRDRETIAKAREDGAPREVLRAMADRARRGFPVEPWTPPPAKGRPARPAIGVYRAR